MAIKHALPGQAIDITPLGSGLSTARTYAIFKSSDLEVMRLVLSAGMSLPPHEVTGEITIQCIEGALNITADGNCQKLRAGHLLFLQGKTLHVVSAIEDSSALVTIALKK